MGRGGEESAMWPRIWVTTRGEREKKGEDNKWDGASPALVRVWHFALLHNWRFFFLSFLVKINVILVRVRVRVVSCLACPHAGLAFCTAAELLLHVYECPTNEMTWDCCSADCFCGLFLCSERKTIPGNEYKRYEYYDKNDNAFPPLCCVFDYFEECRAPLN